MLGKTNRPPVLPGGDRNKYSEAVTSPKSPLDFKIRSPRGMKNCDVIGGIGLGIVAALEKSGTTAAAGVGIPVKLIVGNLNLNLNKSNPIPIVSAAHAKNSTKCRNSSSSSSTVLLDEEESDMDYGESYTYVTCHHGPNKSFTRVYCDGGEVLDDNRLKNLSVFYESPAPAARRLTEAIPVYPTSDFLSSCHLCRKKLHGKDIYMYRGEKAFCSTECRHRQIVNDERKEKCRTEVSRYGDISISPYSGGGQLFSTGIFAT